MKPLFPCFQENAKVFLTELKAGVIIHEYEMKEEYPLSP